MRKLIIIIVVILTVIAINGFAQQGGGYLLIIGGGKRPAYMMERFIELAGGKEAKLVIIPNASGDPIGTAEYQQRQLENLGAENVDYIYVKNEKANEDSVIEKLSGVKGIFFSGGDQRRLPRDLLNTKLLSKIKEIYNNGGVISGTSAGAAVMSEIMITGDEILYPDAEYKFTKIEQGNIKTSQGFGFVARAIIDQHFIERKRHNRLISLTLEKPKLLGIGIDESTAILVYPDKKFEVVGESQVIVYDASDSGAIKTLKNNKISTANVKMHILADGDFFDMKNKVYLE
jgi:cyanophycinase